MDLTKFIYKNPPPSEELHTRHIFPPDVVFGGYRIVTFLSLGVC
jgi:hypothetical protein